MAHEGCPLDQGWRCRDHQEHAIMIGASKWVVSTILALMLAILGGIGGMYVQLGKVEKTVAVTAEVSRRNAELIRDLARRIGPGSPTDGAAPYRLQ